MQTKRWIILAILAIAIGAFFILDLGSYLQLEVLQARIEDLRQWRSDNPGLAALVFFLVYVAVTALSLPGAAIMTLAAGALFGFWTALILVSFASSIGATLAFLVSRTLLRDWVQGRFAQQLRAVNDGFAKDGPFYLFSLRLVPIFPFFVINLLMGLLPISASRFYWVSQLGMLPATAAFVNAGRELGALEDLSGIISPGLLLSFLLLAVFPFLARAGLDILKRRRATSAFTRPKQFDDNLLVIGAGSAGLVSALIAATVRAEVSLVEKHRMGGDCLNTGCVPSKALLRSARIADYGRRASDYGLEMGSVEVDFPRVMQRVHGIIKTIEPHDSVERFTSLGVNCIQGEARLVSPWEVEIDGKLRSARNIVLATGGRPRVPDAPGLADIDYLTSDTVWEIEEAPGRLLVIGAGPIGCELAQAFVRLDVQVTLVTHGERVLPREDEEVSAEVLERFEEQGMTVHMRCEPQSFEATEDAYLCRCRGADGEVVIEFDRVLLAVGRSPNVEGLGLEQVGIALAERGTVEVDAFLRTTQPSVFACGDVSGPYQFTHMASHQAWYVAVNALFGGLRKFRVDYSVVPWATFTDPEVARVGLNELEAAEQGIAVEVTRYDISDHDRAIADGEAHGFVKVLTRPGSDRILGATIVGYHAGELLTEFVLAMKHGLGLNKILGTIHVYPTLGESNKFVAGEWRKARKPEKLLEWVARYHNWRRG
ncbi:MAG: FAD-dependent oxidoreductase [Pseudomonadota bacterium]